MIVSTTNGYFSNLLEPLPNEFFTDILLTNSTKNLSFSFFFRLFSDNFYGSSKK